MAASEALSLQSLEDIFDSGNLSDVFIQHISRICSYAKDDIIIALKGRTYEEISKVRAFLFLELCQHFDNDDFISLGLCIDRIDPVGRNLRKRNKVEKLLDDVYVIGISLAEKSLHKDLKQSVQTTRNHLPTQHCYKSSNVFIWRKRFKSRQCTKY